MAWRIGIDIGGTFTDVALGEEDTGRIAIAKGLTTPPDFRQGVIHGPRHRPDATPTHPAPDTSSSSGPTSSNTTSP